MLSDIHANLVALEAVLADAHKTGFESTWNLGDTVGYGPRPSECIAAIRTLPLEQCLIGNHDAAAIGILRLDNFNPLAKQAALWTQQVLSKEDRSFLAGLPWRTHARGFALAHGSPRDPVWEYVLDEAIAMRNFNYFPETACFVGHHHVASVARLAPGATWPEMWPVVHGEEVSLEHGRHIINPGSTGQPRDGDTRASWALLDTTRKVVSFRRTSYDITATQQQMRAAHLPEPLIRRLDLGL